MNSEMYRCCGYTVEISGSETETVEGQRGHQVHCELCDDDFTVPGDIEAARKAIPTHFLTKHQSKGQLEDWHP